MELVIIIYENMLKIVEPFISLSTDKVILEFSSNEIIYITGNIYTTQTGSHVIIEIAKPDGTSETIIALHNTDGSFVGLIPMDREWSTGEYSVSVTYFNESVTGSFFIQNNWKTSELTESQLVGSFVITSENSHEFTILGISGNIITDESEITLSVTKENIVMYENTITLDDNKSFETSMVLYDYITNSPWEYGE